MIAPLVLLGTALTVTFAYFALASISTRWPITYPEGAQVAAVLRLRNGEPLYPPFLAYPYIITPYPPLLYLLDAGVSALLGLGVYETMVAARALTLATSFGAALLVGMLAVRERVGRIASLTAAALFLPIPLLDQWGFAVRPDLPAIFLSLAAGWLLLRSPRLVWAAGLVVGLALLTKFTAISMPISACIWLVASRRLRHAIVFAASAVGVAGGGAAVTLALSHGEAFGHTVLANMNPLLPMEHAIDIFARLPTLAWFPFAAAVVGMLIQIRSRQLRLSGVYWPVTLAVGLFTLRGRGGDVNYLLEAAAATCWLAAHGLREIWLTLRPRVDARLVALPVVVTIAGLIWGARTFSFWRAEGGVNTDRRLPIEEVAVAPSVLAEEPTMVLLAGKPLVLSDPFNLSQLQTAGRFDPSDLIQRIRQRDFGLIVLRGDVRQTRYINGQPKWPESVRRAIADYYVFSKRVDIYWLYVPDAPRR